MANRIMSEYVGLDRNVIVNKSLSAQAAVAQPGTINPKPGIYNSMKGFLTKEWLWWILHNFVVDSRHKPYPTGTLKSIYTLKNVANQPGPVTIALAADWGSDTPQSAYIADRIREKNPDYTVHMGDVYFSGTHKEISDNYASGLWPQGKVATFALLGNHEMFSGGDGYFDYLENLGETNTATNKTNGQEAPFFCLRNDYWCILGLDTGYDSLKKFIHRNPDNIDLDFQDGLTDWLDKVVDLKNEKRGIIVLTHHQYISAFGGEKNFQNPAKTILKYLGDANRKILWIWGHEHRFSIYGKYQESAQHITAYGRCIGNGGMCDEHTEDRVVNAVLGKNYNLVLYDYRVADTLSGTEIGYNSYALVTLNGNQAVINYKTAYNDTDTGITKTEQNIITETWTANNQTGEITCTGMQDGLQGNPPNESLTPFLSRVPMDAGKP